MDGNCLHRSSAGFIKRATFDCAAHSDELDAGRFPLQPSRELSSGRVRVCAHGALPDNGDPPAIIDQRGYGRGVSNLVARKFRVPERRPGFGQTEIGTAGMAVPKASVYEYGRIPHRQHQIRLSRQPLVMKAVSETRTPQIFPDKEFRAGILASDA